MTDFVVSPVGHVHSDLRDLADAPRQGDEGAPPATIIFAGPTLRAAWADLAVGDRLVVLTYLDRADRSVLTVHPRGDPAHRPLGVFSTRSPHRPNPIGLHEVEVLAVEADAIRVSGIEVVDGTPVLDVKPVLGPLSER
jgi:tRNA-Thr(GGU) m(6)t(6)A37 methyltransferase TsaA